MKIFRGHALTIECLIDDQCLINDHFDKYWEINKRPMPNKRPGLQIFKI